MPPAMKRSAAAATLMLAAMLGACEHPLPPANPAPLPAAAERLGVPVSVLRDLQETANRLQHATPSGTSSPALSAREVERLRRTLRLLEQSYGMDARRAR